MLAPMPSSSSSSGARRSAGRRVVRLVRRDATGGDAVLRPHEVRAQLAVSASTLRAWSDEFKDYLSPAARTSAGGHAHRRYTAGDVEVLKRIGQLLQSGHRCEEVKQLLRAPRPSGDRSAALVRAPDAEHDRRHRNDLVEVLVEREGQLRCSEEARGRLRQLVETLGERADGYKQQLEAEQAAHAETRRVLREVQRRLAEAERQEERLSEVNAGLHAQVKLLEREMNASVWRRFFR